MDDLKVRCEQCEAKFLLKDVDLKARKLKKDIIEIYFFCPKCNTEYPVIKTDGKIRGLQNQQKKLTDTIKKQGRQMTASELMMYTVRQKRIKALLDKLNNKVMANG